MKKALFSAAVLAASLPFTSSAGPTSFSAGRPSLVRHATTAQASHASQTPVYYQGGTGNGYSFADPTIDQSFENWVYPVLTQLIQDISARRSASAANGFLSLKTTLQAKGGHRYHGAWSQVSTAEDLVRQGYFPASANIMQALLNNLRSTAAKAQQSTYGNGYYPPPVYTTYPQGSTHPVPAQSQAERARQVRLAQLNQSIAQIQQGDLYGARNSLHTLASSIEMRRPQSRRAQKMRQMADQLNFANSGWAVRELTLLKNKMLAFGRRA